VDRRHRRGLQTLGIFFALCAGAFALDPSLQIRQYAHKSWRVRDGFFRGSIYSIAQTPDGYLWLGTEFGLVRFDGVRAVTWQPLVDPGVVAGRIVKLLTARDGTLWIGAETGLASLKDSTLTQYPELSQQRVSSLLEDRQGTVWAGSVGVPTGKFCSIQNGRARCFDEEAMVEGGVVGLHEDKQDRLWVAVPSGLWQWKPGPPKFYPIPDQPSGVRPVGEDEDGSLLINRLSRRVVRFVDGRIKSSPLQQAIPDDHVWPLLRDRDGGLWVPTFSHGLVHVQRGRVDKFDESEGLSGDAIRDLFEDDEGNIWVATLDGLDQFRDVAVPAFTVKQGLLNPVVWSVLAPRDGGLWLGSALGLGRWHEGRITRFGAQGGLLNGAAPHSLFEDLRGRIWVSTSREFGYLQGDRFVPMSGVPAGYVRAIAEDRAGDMWLINEQHGLIRLRDESVEQITWAALGRKDVATSIVADPRQGGIWLGFLRGDIAYFSGGGLQATYSAKDGLGPGDVLSMRLDAHGALWVATAGGLSRLRNGAFATLSSKNGLPCDRVHWSMEDADQLWLYTACGLVRIARSEMDLWAAAVEKNEDSKIRVKVTVLDNFDGVRSNLVFHGLTPRVAKTSDGRLWFLPPDGLSVIDPHRFQVNKLPPPVHIEQVIADDKPFEATNGTRLPPRNHNLAIDYSALSLVVPEKVRFRVKLEGQDKDWRELVNVRHVEYTNLPPRHYRFRVLACNNSGVWNEEGASLDFVIPPMWYQTNWFYALCAAAFLGLLWAAYQLRLRQLAAQFNMRLEERVAERTRVARDLHDTLLQSFQGLLPLFQIGIRKLPEGAVDSRKTLQSAIDRASQAIGEGRDAIKGLRMSTIEKNDLAVAIRTIGEEFAAGENGRNPISFQLLVEGTPRNLHPILRDEVYRLATEALRNSFRHSAAHNIEVEIRYDENYLRLRVRDDGKGIPSDVLSQEGREGHYGLPGMRERAKLVGGKLTIWTELDSGTEIELVIPGAKAYVKSARPFWYFGKRSATETDEKETIERE
jgi:signal transduction histidine kinase/ligand-binding sensor domain-containing protein